MRKLTVKTFSVIKDAELEFGRIIVLIGPQAEGKSLLCKLAYFLGGEIIGFAVDSLLDRNSWDEYLQSVINWRVASSQFGSALFKKTGISGTLVSRHIPYMELQERYEPS